MKMFSPRVHRERSPTGTARMRRICAMDLSVTRFWSLSPPCVMKICAEGTHGVNGARLAAFDAGSNVWESTLLSTTQHSGSALNMVSNRSYTSSPSWPAYLVNTSVLKPCVQAICDVTLQLKACAPVVMPYADFVQRIVLVVATVDVNAAWVQHAVGRKDKEDLDGSIAAIRDVTIEHVLIARSVRTHSRGCTRDTIVQVRTRTVSLGRPYFLKMWRTSCQRSRRNCEHAPFGTWDTSHRQHTSNCPWVSPTRMHLVPAGTGTAMQLPAGV